MLNNITVYNSYDYKHLPVGEMSAKVNEIYQSNSENCQKLSGGEKQIISLLRSFAQNCNILLMDEPFSAIDYALKQEIISYITTADAFKEKIIVVISHDVSNENLSHFDYRVSMCSGKIDSIERCK